MAASDYWVGLEPLWHDEDVRDIERKIDSLTKKRDAELSGCKRNLWERRIERWSAALVAMKRHGKSRHRIGRRNGREVADECEV